VNLSITKKPSRQKTQYALPGALRLTGQQKFEFFNLAASERGEIPVNVYDYLLWSEELFEEIRARKSNWKTGE